MAPVYHIGRGCEREKETGVASFASELNQNVPLQYDTFAMTGLYGKSFNNFCFQHQLQIDNRHIVIIAFNMTCLTS